MNEFQLQTHILPISMVLLVDFSRVCSEGFMGIDNSVSNKDCYSSASIPAMTNFSKEAASVMKGFPESIRSAAEVIAAKIRLT